ncbi:PREDICTED: 21 kDa protein-like [Tarenaya hassleriana]|uniref:21 kDa protein-like n=1 Tax=Tarenaya hassleriana TaxID=28532 RepID=UPI00053C452E|nr:PREDICTED: 21 kDa protein-like [Tarenaya hassleriana]
MSKENHSLLLLVLVCISHIFSIAAANATAPKRAENFVKATCRTTTYPTECVRSLSLYADAIQASPQRLAHTALAVSLNRALSTKIFVSRFTRFKGLTKREYRAIEDCVEEISDTVDRLTKSVKEFKMCSRGDGNGFWYHMSNVQTWMSAALTDENTCSDGFAGRIMDGRVKNSVRARIVNMSQETSNALALINYFASKKQ